jgi:circadian clock protein KaiC
MIERIKTGIPNLDYILGGGLPAHSLVFVSGSPGSGKTVLVTQIIFNQATAERKGLIITTASEPLSRLIRYTQTFSFFDLNKIGQAIFYEDIGPYLLEPDGEKPWKKIEELVQQYQPSFLLIDSVKAIHDLSPSPSIIRRGLFRLASILSTLPCTAFLIGEDKLDEYWQTIEASIVDVIIHLEEYPVGLGSRRIIKIKKVRGSNFLAGEHTFKIDSDGLRIFPRFITPPKPTIYQPLMERANIGIPGFDTLLFPGGILRGTTTLIAGDPGVGKTVTALHFLLNEAQKGEPGVYVTFQEDPNQMALICHRFGFDLEKLTAQEKLILLYNSPVEVDIDELAIDIIEAVQKIKAKRLVIDSISDLISGARGDPDRFYNFVYSFVQWLKDRSITAMITNEMSQLFANELTLTGRGVSHIADNIIMMRYTEIEGEIRRALVVLSARASDHNKKIFEYLISEKEGPRLGQPLKAAFTLFQPTTRVD